MAQGGAHISKAFSQKQAQSCCFEEPELESPQEVESEGGNPSKRRARQRVPQILSLNSAPNLKPTSESPTDKAGSQKPSEGQENGIKCDAAQAMGRESATWDQLSELPANTSQPANQPRSSGKSAEHRLDLI